MNPADTKLLFLALGSLSFSLMPVSAAEQIRLSSAMLINLSGNRSADELVDEQDFGKVDGEGKRGNPKSFFVNSWENKELYFPLSIVIDLGVEHSLSEIGFFDEKGNGNLRVEYRCQKKWQPIFQDDLKRFQKWVMKDVLRDARYLRFTFESPSANIGEIL